MPGLAISILPEVRVLLNVAAPAALISNVRALIVAPPSLPCIIRSPSDTIDLRRNWVTEPFVPAKPYEVPPS